MKSEKNLLQTPLKNTTETKLKSFQYKLLTGILPAIETKWKLSKVNWTLLMVKDK